VQLRCPDGCPDDISDDMYERGVPGGALNLNYTDYPDHGRYGDLPLLGKIPTAEPGIEPGTSCLVVRSSDHQAARLVPSRKLLARFFVFCYLKQRFVKCVSRIPRDPLLVLRRSVDTFL
jgi:hypothetical protein